MFRIAIIPVVMVALTQNLHSFVGIVGGVALICLASLAFIFHMGEKFLGPLDNELRS